MRPFNGRVNVARARQRNIYQITSPTTCNLHANRQASELRLNSFFVSTTLLSFEQLIHLDYFIWWRVGWWPGGVRTTIALHCCWMISNMAAEAWLFGEFSYAFFKSMTSYIAFYFT